MIKNCQWNTLQWTILLVKRSYVSSIAALFLIESLNWWIIKSRPTWERILLSQLGWVLGSSLIVWNIYLNVNVTQYQLWMNQSFRSFKKNVSIACACVYCMEFFLHNKYLFYQTIQSVSFILAKQNRWYHLW